MVDPRQPCAWVEHALVVILQNFPSIGRHNPVHETSTKELVNVTGAASAKLVKLARPKSCA